MGPMNVTQAWAFHQNDYSRGWRAPGSRGPYRSISINVSSTLWRVCLGTKLF